MRVASSALSDTLLLAFWRAYAGEPPLVRWEARMHRCAHALLRLAVCVMGECEA